MLTISTNMAVGQQILYASGPGSGQLLTINPITGVGTAVGPFAPGMGPTAIDFRFGKLYCCDLFGQRIAELDPATGSTITTHNIGAFPGGEGDMAIRSDGIGYVGSSGGALIEFDISVPSSKLVGNVGPLRIDGLAFNSADVLYMLTETGSDLYTIDQTTWTATLVGKTGIAGAGAGTGGLAFDAAGNLYATVDLGGPSSFYKIDPVTAVGTLIGPIGFNLVTGLRFTPGAPPPPPPIPIPGGGIGEGNYPGSKGLANGGEGTFGFGRHLRQPFLKSPHRDSHGNFRVFNVTHQQRMQAAEADSGLGVVGRALLSLAVLMPAAVVFGRRRPA
ncbi:MAG: hypothetical protein EXS16_06070 [Gemmataceae bacterium]|nr:hypothetical protein [Gemmataceae bacterium]